MKQSTIFDSEEMKSKGYHCSCCGNFVKMYKRSMNSNMAISLIALYKHNKTEFVHLEKFLNEHGYQRCGDASYLVHYGMIDKLICDRADGSPKNGFYRLNEAGINFVEKLSVARKHFKMFNGKFMGFEGDWTTIEQALGNKFSYSSLMGLS